MEHRLFLSKRNVQTLLNKLDRNKHGEGGSVCTIIKCDNLHAKYPQTMRECAVVAVEKPEDAYANGGKFTSSRIFLDRETLSLMSPGSTTMLSLKDGTDVDGDIMLVTCLEDKEYYDTREPGMVHPADDPGVKK